MTSQDAEPQESRNISTIHRIYRTDDDNDDVIVLRDPINRRSFINRSAYAKLHRTLSSSSKRHSVDNLKGRYESFGKEGPEPTEPEVNKFTPATFGYPKTAKLKPPLLKPKPVLAVKKPSKDENSNLVKRNSAVGDAGEEVRVVVQKSESEESVDKIAQELDNFTMDGKPKKRSSGFKKFVGSLFGKDKKKKEEEKYSNIVYNDNVRNESNFGAHKLPMNSYKQEPQASPQKQQLQEERMKELEQKYAEMHVSRFNQIRQSFTGEKREDVVDTPKKKPTISDYISTPVNRYIDTSSTASTESEKPNGNVMVVRDTPPRAQEIQQNFKLVKPKASIPLNSERSLPNPYQNEKVSPRTIERNLNRSNSKDYPDKSNFSPSDIKPLNSPKSPSLETSKLKLPSNREIYGVQPRMKSPIPSNRVSTEKLIATELLKNAARSPTPPKRTVSMVPDKPLPSVPDKIVTNALVHAPRRAPTPLEVSTYRAQTPVELRIAASMKTSPKKDDIKKSIEQYYWKELKKLKEEEDSRFVQDYEESRLRRSRSLSPNSQRAKRSYSLPRDGRVVYTDYGRLVPHQPIPEDHPMEAPAQYFVYDQAFVRNNPMRQSVDSLQRPIFRRGSLLKQEVYDSQPYNKRVSFSSPQQQQHQQQQAWLTRNGYAQSPAHRRENPYVSEPVYGRYVSEPVYSNRVLEQFRAQQPYLLEPRRLSMDFQPLMQDVYVSRGQLVRPLSSMEPPDSHQNSVYSSRQSVNEPQRQVTVRDKVCDIYGQIHDTAPDSRGVVMGRLQGPRPAVPPRQSYQPQSFVRGSRLTASASDLGVAPRYTYRGDPRVVRVDYNSRPLPSPPPPPPDKRNVHVSDTESGSDASEIQRIMQSKSKSKKRAVFGK